jgi:hypothetical protein
MNLLLDAKGNTKTAKQATGFDIKSYNLSMAPYGNSEESKHELRKICPFASKGCVDTCLTTSGHGNIPKTIKSRKRKLDLYLNDRAEFVRQLIEDLNKVEATAIKRNSITACRLNVISDVSWEKILPHYGHQLTDFPHTQFYDYTAIFSRLLGNLPANYFLIFSLKENNKEAARKALKMGKNLAVVFRGGFPKTFWNYPVKSGENHDFRFLEEQNNPVVIGLTPKGKAIKDTSGFVLDYTGPHM